MDFLNAIMDMVWPIYNEAIMGLQIEKRPDRPSAMISDEVSLVTHVGAFVEHGRNIFFLTQNVVELLDRTDLGEVRCGDIQLPFDCFYVSFGDAFDAGLPGPENRIDGAYITTHPQQGGSFQVVVTSRRLDVRNPDKPNRWPLSRDLYFYAPLDFTDLEASIESVVEKAVASGKIKVEQTVVAPDDDMIAETLGEPVLVQDVRHLTDAEQAAWTRDAMPAFRRSLALVVNGLCYLNSTDADGEDKELPDDAPPELVALWKSPKVKLRDRAKAGLLERGFIPIIVRKSGSATHEGIAGGGTEGRAVGAHWRRGHWRRQPYGQGRALIKLKWIRPTLVAAEGTEIDDTNGHLYRVV